MLKLLRIAITGGVASGKSAVCEVFRTLGAFVADADVIVHELLDPQTDLGQQIIRLLGTEILESGTLSRRKIADLVFNNPETLHALEQLLHPAVHRKIEELYKNACRSGAYNAFAVEIPLLYETGGEVFYDAVVAVVSDSDESRSRFMRAGFDPSDYERRMNRQMDPQEKARRADYVIQNTGSKTDLIRKAKETYALIQQTH